MTRTFLGSDAECEIDFTKSEAFCDWKRNPERELLLQREWICPVGDNIPHAGKGFAWGHLHSLPMQEQQESI